MAEKFTPSGVRSPSTPTFTLSTERVTPRFSSPNSSKLFPDGVQPFAVIPAPKQEIKLHPPQTIAPNPDKVFKSTLDSKNDATAPLKKIKTRSLMPTGVTHFATIPSPHGTRIQVEQPKPAIPNPDKVFRGSLDKTVPIFQRQPDKSATLMPKGVTLFTTIPAPIMRESNPSLSKPSNVVVEKGQPSKSNESGNVSSNIKASQPSNAVLKQNLPIRAEVKPVYVRPELVTGNAQLVHRARALEPDLQTEPKNKVIVLSGPNKLQISPTTRTRTLNTPTRIFPPVVDQAEPYTQLAVSSLKPMETLSLVRDQQLIDRLMILRNIAHAEQQTVTIPAPKTETGTNLLRFPATERTVQRRTHTRTLQEEQRPYRVAIRSSVKEVERVYKELRDAGKTKQEAYTRSVELLRAVLTREQVPPTVIDRVVMARTRRYFMRMEMKVTTTIQRLARRRSKMAESAREGNRARSAEDGGTPPEFIMIEHKPTATLRLLIFRQVIDSLGTPQATLRDVVRGVMEHPWMPKMKSPILYMMYSPQDAEKFLLDGLLLKRLEEWSHDVQVRPKDQLWDMVQNMLCVTPAVATAIKTPDSPPPVDQVKVYEVIHNFVDEDTLPRLDNFNYLAAAA